MAVAVQMEFKGDMDQYEQVIQKMGFSHGGSGAPAASSTGSRRPTAASA